MNKTENASPTSIASNVREMYRCVVGDEKIDRLVCLLGEAATPVRFDEAGLRQDLATVLQWLRSIGGLDHMGEGNPLVKTPAIEALVDLAELAGDTETSIDRPPQESEALRRGVVIEASGAELSLFRAACAGAYEAVLNDNTYPPEDPILEACADELDFLAGAFREVGDQRRAEACAMHENNIRRALRRIPALMEGLATIENHTPAGSSNGTSRNST